MPSIFATSDTHWYHDRILEYDNRPFVNMSHMLDSMIYRWNEVVGPDDIVYHLGDVGLVRGGYETRVELLREFNNYLNGRKILIRGNHDKSEAEMLQCGFDEVHTTYELDYNGTHLFMKHDPMTLHARVLLTPPPATDVVLHGHVHTAWFVTTNGQVPFVNVGTMWWGYAPVELGLLLRGLNDEIDEETPSFESSRR